MSGNAVSHVRAAFEILLEEIELEIDLVSRAGAEAFEARAYDRAGSVADQAKALTTFREKIGALRKEWDTVSAARGGTRLETPTQRRNLGRLRRGERTPEAAYYRPILDTLVELGGSGNIGDVLDRVQRRMKDALTKVDYEPLGSDPDMPRWRNTAQWARNAMVNEGLLKSDSPRGVWEISEAGRAWLSQQ